MAEEGQEPKECGWPQELEKDDLLYTTEDERPVAKPV